MHIAQTTQDTLMMKTRSPSVTVSAHGLRPAPRKYLPDDHALAEFDAARGARPGDCGALAHLSSIIARATTRWGGCRRPRA